MQLYRAKASRKRKGSQWVQGFFQPIEAPTTTREDKKFSEFLCSIIESPSKSTMCQVSTLCRYTEIDHKGQKIFENDVVREWIEDSQEPKGGAWSYSIVVMHEGSWCLNGIQYDYSEPEPLWGRLSDEDEIVGSIFDHQELLKDDTQPSN